MNAQPLPRYTVRVAAAIVLALALLAVPIAGLGALPMGGAASAEAGVPARMAAFTSRADLSAAWDAVRSRLPSALAASSAEREIRSAWRRARDAGAYRFTASVRQTVQPEPSIFNAGRQTNEQDLYLEGESDLDERRLRMTLWSHGGSVADATGGLEIEVDGDRARARQGSGDWEAIPNFAGLFAPQGDFMAFLSAARDVARADGAAVGAGTAPSDGPTSPDDDAPSGGRRFTFAVDGPRYAAYVRDQTERRLADEGELPPNVALSAPRSYAEMTGAGELWIDAAGLPRRQVLRLDFPGGPDDGAVHAEVTVDFAGFDGAAVASDGSAGGALAGSPTTGGAPAGAVSAGGLVARLGSLAADSPVEPSDLALFALVAGLGVVVVSRRESRRLYAVLATVLVAIMIATPLLQAASGRAFARHLQSEADASAAPQQQSRMETQLQAFMGGADRDPHADPLAAAAPVGATGRDPVAGDAGAGADAPGAAVAMSLAADDGGGDPDAEAEECDDADTGDGDGDGLSKYEECLLALSDEDEDTDGDGIADDIEIAGFEHPAGSGQMWYTDAGDMDSNDDGLDDGREWNTGRGEGETPRDTDGDGTPDLFDRDNDGDGVPDHLDTSPYYRGMTVYSASEPLQYVLDSLTAGKRTVAEIQLRPTNLDHLWYAFNVLDWPKGDQEGQVQDVDGRTFYDEDHDTSRSPNDNGDVKLVPMLEIRIAGAPDNLPPEDELEDYGIGVQPLDDAGDDKAVYVPLTLVVEPKGDTRLAFVGRMPYDPGDEWGNAHQVRLVWVVQALTDVCKRYKEGRCVAYDSTNKEKVVHTYLEDEWTLTGMSVREDRGTDMAVVYEDPAVDGDLADDSGLMFLTRGLELTFLAGSDCEEWDDKGTDEPDDDVCVRGDDERDITIPEIHRRFNHDTNSGVSITETWRIPDKVGDILTVVTDTYTTRDEAVATTGTDVTEGILDDHFTGHRPVTPTLLYAREERFRSLNLDEDAVGDDDAPIAWSEGGRQLEMDLVEDDVPEQTVAGLNWAPFRYRAGDWEAYPIEDYWDEVGDRFSEAFAGEFGDEEDPDEVRDGAVFVGQIYYLTMYTGVSVAVESGGKLIIQKYQSDDRPIAFNMLSMASKAILPVVKIWLMRDFANSVRAMRYLAQVVISSGESARKSFQPTAATLGNLVTKWKNVGRWIGAKGAVTVGVMLAIAALAVGVYFLVRSHLGDNPDATIALAVIVGALMGYLSVVAPLLTAMHMITALTESGMPALRATAQVLSISSEFVGISRVISAIGLVIGLGIIVGVFIYALVKEEGLRRGLGFSVLLAQTIAAALFLVLSVVLALTIVGAVIVGIIGLVDTILAILGTGWSVSGAITSALTWTFFSFELAVQPDADDLVKMGELDTHLVDPDKGIVPGAQLEFATTVTSTVHHRDPRDTRTAFYIWMYDEEQIRSTSFEYELDDQAHDMLTELYDTNRMQNWHISGDHVRDGHQMYQGWIANNLSTSSGPVEPGVNRTVPLQLSLGYALPGIECWSIPLFYWILPIIVCHRTGLEDQFKASDLGSSIVLDVFPPTLDEFVAVANWAPEVKLKDADGDGLLAQDYDGSDPDDTDPDIDGDLLSDAWELDMATRALDEGGAVFDVAKADTDGDGLGDQQEAYLGTNPGAADTDLDGISDAAELEGYDFYYNYPHKTRVTSDPLNADIDGDGMDDLFERTLHTDCAAESDETARRDCYRDNPYNPHVWNTNPIGVYTEVGEEDLVVKPSQSFLFTTTVQNNVKTGTSPWVRGDATVDPDPITGNPLQMLFDVAKGRAQSLYSTLTVPSGTSNQDVTILTTVNSQLHTPSAWAWDAWEESTKASNSPNAGWLAITPVAKWNTAYAGVSRENWRVRGYSITPGGISGDPTELLGSSSKGPNAEPAIACNDAGRCIVAYTYEISGGSYDGCNAVEWRTGGPGWGSLSSAKEHTWCDGRSLSGAAVASDGDGFVVAWQDSLSGTERIVARRVTSNGDTTGAMKALDSGPSLDLPRATWTGSRFLVAYEKGSDVYLGSMTLDATIGSPVALAATSASEWGPYIAYDNRSGRSLVLYTRRVAGDRSIRGRIVAGSDVSDEFTIANVSDEAGWEMALSADPVNGGWIVVWGLNGKKTTYAVGVGMNGEVRGEHTANSLSTRNYQFGVGCAQPRPEHLYHLDEAAGATTFEDSSGFEHDAQWWHTAANMPQKGISGEPGKRGQAVWLRGNGNFLYADANVTQIAGSVTLWFKAECATCGITSISSRGSKTPTDRNVYLQDGRLCAKLNGQPICSSSGGYGDGQWHQLAHTFGARVDGQRLYADRVLVASGDMTSSSLGGDRQLNIGYAQGGVVKVDSGYESRDWFQGTVDEVKVYPHALSEGEVKNDYYGPMVVYPFDDPSGARTFNNASGSGYAAGTCSSTGCPQAAQKGMAYNAIKLDGSNDVVSGASVPLNQSSFTIAAWAKRDGTGRDEYIVSQGADAANQDLFMGFWSNDKFICAFDTSNYLVTSATYTDTDWHLWACTYDYASGKRTIYRDGTQIAQNTTSAYYRGTGALRIGKARWGNYWKGVIDEFAVWPDAMPADDMKTLYRKVKAIDDSVTECMIGRPTPDGYDALHVHRTALHETTTTLGRSEQQVEDEITVDGTLPTARITSLTNNQHINPTGSFVLSGVADDNTFVRTVELSIDGGAWQVTDGAETWSFDWDTSPYAEGSHTLRVRAVDPADNVGNPVSLSVFIDRTPPLLAVTSVRRKAWYDNDAGRWKLEVRGTVTDQTDGSVSVMLGGEIRRVVEDSTATRAGNSWQSVSYATNGASPRDWGFEYLMPEFDDDGNALPNPTGIYTVYLRARDVAGNATDEQTHGRAPVDNRPTETELIATGPYTDVIVGTSTVLTGTITDPGPEAVGVSTLWVYLEPTNEQNALFWQTRENSYYGRSRAELAASGPGVTTTTWSLPVPGTEGFLPIRLEGYDVDPYPYQAGRVIPWNGMIDTSGPRVKPYLYNWNMPYGPTDIDCYVEDLNLDEDSFVGCPCPKSTWRRTYFHEVNEWYRETVSDTTRLVRIEAECQVPGMPVIVSHRACDTYGQCTTGSYSPLGKVPTPPEPPTPRPTPRWGPTPLPSPTPLPTPSPTPTLAPPPELPVDSAVFTPTNRAVFTSTSPVAVEGKAFAEGYLQSLSVTVGGVSFHTRTWPNWPAPGWVTETLWSTTFTPPGEGHYVLDSSAGDWAGRTQTSTHPITFTVDLLPPAPPTFATTVITSSRRAAQGVAVIDGAAADAIGVTGVDVNPGGLGWRPAVLSGDPANPSWEYLWPIGDEDPDGVVYNVAARAVDGGGRTASTSVPIRFDLAPPSDVGVTLSYRDLFGTPHAVRPYQVITDGNLLSIAWTPAADGSGVAGYWVDWAHNPVSTTEAVFVPDGTVYTYSEAVAEASEVYAHIATVDGYGNRGEQVLGPVYVDAALTPDLLRAQRPPDLQYHGWMASGCTQLGVNRRVPDNAWGPASLAEEQLAFATWDAEALRLAWAGADWDYEGDLFVYLDTQPGGATQLYNPYGGMASGIYLPGNLALPDISGLPVYEQVRQTDAYRALTTVAMQADYVLMVEDADTATLLAWNPGSGSWEPSRALGPDQLGTSRDRIGDDPVWKTITDVYLPFDQLGIMNPTTSRLGLLSVASEEDTLDLWTVFPERNPVTSGSVVNPLAATTPAQDFGMVWSYRWESLASLLCPCKAAVELPSEPGPTDGDLRAEIVVSPTGTTYSFFGDDLYSRWREVFSAPGAKSQQFTFLDNAHPPVGDGNTVTYALRVTNHGTTTAAGVHALVRSYYALTLPGGNRVDPSYMEYRDVPVGIVAPGATVTATIVGVIDVDTNWRYTRCLTVDGLPEPVCRELLRWAVLDAVVFDAVSPFEGTPGIPTSPPLEWVWADHAVDIDPPTAVAIDPALFVVAPGGNAVSGTARDPSGVAWVQLEITNPLGAVSVQTCADPTPLDGAWSCAVAFAGADGATFTLRVRAADRHGHVSAWSSPPRPVVLDAAAPVVTLDEADRDAVQGQIVGPGGHLLHGTYADNHAGGVVQACRETPDGTECDDAEMLLATQAPAGTGDVYDDIPASPVPIGGDPTCSAGTVVRTFAVADEFAVGDVDLGFGADHPNRGEIVVDLVSPSGTRARVIAADTTMVGFSGYDVWLDDAAPDPVHVPVSDDPASPYYERAAYPDSALAVFAGETSLGEWQVRVCDVVPGVNDGTYEHARLGLTARTTDVSASGTWSYALPVVDGADGLAQSLALYGIDGVGNTTAPPITLAYVLDVVAPVLNVTTVVDPVTDPWPAVTLAGTVTDGLGVSEVYVRVDPPTGTSYRALASWTGTAWSFSLRPEEVGVHTLWVEARDLAGNVKTDGPFEVDVMESAIPDLDGDGVPNTVEDAAPNAGDGNLDGTPDKYQGDVASLPNAVDGAYITLIAPDEMQLAKVTAVGNPSPGTAPAGVAFPVGFVAFELTPMPAPPESVTLALVLAGAVAINQYWRYGPETADPAAHWYRFDPPAGTPAVGATIASGTRIDLTFVDGAKGDDDLTADGVLVDQGGPGRQEQPTAVELAAFGATARGRTVLLAWETGSEPGVLGFHVYRRTWGRPLRVQVDRALVVARGTGASGATYALEDRPGVGRHEYWLEVVRADGSREAFGPVEVRIRGVVRYPPVLE